MNALRSVIFATLLLGISIGMLAQAPSSSSKKITIPFDKKNGNSPNSFKGTSVQESIEKVKSALFLINNKYMEDVEMDKIAEDAIKGMLEKLDPHSVYFSKDEYKKMNEPLTGNFEGIGVSFNLLRDTIVVTSVIQGGPSEQVGILPGDQIVAVNGENVAGISIDNAGVMSRLRGNKGTVVNVGIRRRSESKLVEFRIIRDKIPVYSVDAVYMAAPEVGYIKLSRFANTTTEEIREAFAKLKAQNAKNLILDLRGNGGGYLKTAVELSNEFIDNNKMIVYTEGKGSEREEYKAQASGSFKNGKLIVLIDEGSASASEIVSGAVQDWDRGLLVGRRTFGKGLVQRPFMLPDSSWIRLTVAHYYTPSGRCIQKPYNDGRDAYYKDIEKRIKSGELTDQAQIVLPDSLSYFTLNKKRVVYGGGGIMPDIFVPLDTVLFTEYYKELNRKGLINRFSLEYVNANRTQLNTDFPTIDVFEKNFAANDEMLNSFYELAEKEGVKRNDADIATSKSLFTNGIKSLIARYLFDSTAYYRISNPINPIYKKALEAINDPKYNQFWKGK